MNWWSDTEAQALRAKTPAAMAQALFQRLREAGIDENLAFTPAYDLAQLYALSADFAKTVDSVLAVRDGDIGALRRHAFMLCRWADYAAAWTRDSYDSFNQLMDGLELDQAELSQREAVEADAGGSLPEEESKASGRYRQYHLLYERLDLKLASASVEERIHRGLSRSLARVYEQALGTVRDIGLLERDQNPRFRATARLLLDLNTTWHFDLGPYQLGHGRLVARGLSAPGLKGWLYALLQASCGF